MAKRFNSWMTAALALPLVLMIGGCPAGDAATEQGSANTDETAYAVLSETVTARNLEEVALPAIDETPETTVEAGDTIPFESIPVEIEDIFAEVETLDGGLPLVFGGLTGRFVNDDPNGSSDDSPGEFHGQWFGADGVLRGHVHGRYVPTPPQELPPDTIGGGVFQGRCLDNQDRFMGILRGRYGHSEKAPGRFFGRWLDRDERLVGVLKGHWTEETETDGGVFRGRWAGFNICAEADSLPASDFENVNAATEAVLADSLPAPESFKLDRMIEPAEIAEQEIAEDAEMLAPGGVPCIDPDRPFGFLHGGHHPTPPDDPEEPGPRAGVFHGHWLSGLGHAHGGLHGLYIEEPEGSPDGAHILGHFHGHYLDPEGVVRGVIHGVYGISEHGLGVFRGRFFNLDDEPLGILRGRWTNNPNRPAGPFSGIWIGVDFEAPPPDGD